MRRKPVKADVWHLPATPEADRVLLNAWPRRIAQAVAHVLGVDVAEIFPGPVLAGGDRARGYATRAKHVACWAWRELIPGEPSWRVLGQIVGIKHETIRFGHGRFARALQDPAEAERAQAILDGVIRRLERWPAFRAHAALTVAARKAPERRGGELL